MEVSEHDGVEFEMSKPEKLYIDGKDYFLWPYEEQTQMKHKVVTDYFKLWAMILGKYYTVSYFDCFGGCGAYLDKDTVYYGSPFLAAEAASDLKENNGRKVELFVTEPDKENYDNLLKVKDELQGKLSVLPSITQKTFEEIINHEWTIKKYKNPKNPIFFFIDPFGYSLDFGDIKDIMRFQKNEMVINFMYDYISRFVNTTDNPKLEERYDRFFGCKEWRDARSLSGEEREKKLVDLYKRQLKKSAKFVFPYKLSFPDKDRTYYYLFHVTNDSNGCSIMKSVFAKRNLGRVEYLGKKSDELTLFDLQEFKIGDIKSTLISKYSGREMSFTEIVEDIIDETLFIEKDIRTAIKEMKKEGSVSISPVTSKTGNGLQGDDMVSFKQK